MTPGELLERLPPDIAALDDLRWLLEQLREQGTIRLNCGGPEYRATGGTVFAADRCVMAGRSSRVVPVEIAATEDDALYQRQRFFPPGDASPSGYAFALPPGVHRVTLHFAEIWFRVPGMRRRYETGPVRGRPASKASKPTGGGT